MGILAMLEDELNKGRAEGDKVKMVGTPARRIATGCGRKPTGKGRGYSDSVREYALNEGISLAVAKAVLEG
jgi:hypothetical protein